MWLQRSAKALQDVVVGQCYSTIGCSCRVMLQYYSLWLQNNTTASPVVKIFVLFTSHFQKLQIGQLFHQKGEIMNSKTQFFFRVTFFRKYFPRKAYERANSQPIESSDKLCRPSATDECHFSVEKLENPTFLLYIDLKINLRYTLTLVSSWLFWRRRTLCAPPPNKRCKSLAIASRLGPLSA